jgi:soluble lytic murein transglycosylase-like protein
MSVLIGLWLAKPATAVAPQTNNQEINPPYGPISPASESIPEARKTSEKVRSNIERENKSVGTYSGRHYSKEEVIQLIKDYSARYGINPDLPLRIAKCESGYNHLAKNKTSSASGTFQYLSSTWAGTDEGRAGLSVFDADANVRAAIKYIASRGHAQPWNASKSCWSRV